ncbi:MAG: hypothetical protein B0A82_23000 [Alkalinema sp. CACIAM 70d]|nr:MAG: hypothetical protein B0A82_23000 [Alkalinema sp. CACIAM 70d]
MIGYHESKTSNHKLQGQYSMGAKLKHWGSLLLTVTLGFLPMAAVQAQEPTAATVYRPDETIPDAMDREFFDHAKTYVNSRDFPTTQNFHTIFGPEFPENAIIKDAKSVHRIYRYLLELQTDQDPYLRTADLENPFNTSVQFLPSQTGRMAGNELIFDSGVPAVPAPAPVLAPPPVMAPEPIAAPPIRRPVEAKF